MKLSVAGPKMSDVKLCLKFDKWEEYYPAVLIKCDVCNETFQVKKGLFLEGKKITCYKHIKITGNVEEE